MNLQQNDNNEQSLKRIRINFIGGTRETQEAFISPATTTADLLRELKSDPSFYRVSKGPSNPIFGEDETLYPQLEEGGLIYVFPTLHAS